MEQQNKLYFKNNYIHRNMHTFYIKQQSQHHWKNPKEFEEEYTKLVYVDRAENKYNEDYKKKLDTEM